TRVRMMTASQGAVGRLDRLGIRRRIDTEDRVEVPRPEWCAGPPARAPMETTRAERLDGPRIDYVTRMRPRRASRALQPVGLQLAGPQPPLGAAEDAGGPRAHSAGERLDDSD